MCAPTAPYPRLWDMPTASHSLDQEFWKAGGRGGGKEAARGMRSHVAELWRKSKIGAEGTVVGREASSERVQVIAGSQSVVSTNSSPCPFLYSLGISSHLHPCLMPPLSSSQRPASLGHCKLQASSQALSTLPKADVMYMCTRTPVHAHTRVTPICTHRAYFIKRHKDAIHICAPHSAPQERQSAEMEFKK